MKYKQLVKYLPLILTCLMVSGCFSSQGSKDSLSKEEKSKLYLQMGVRYLEMNMLKEAKDNLEAAEKIDSNNANTHNTLAALYERLSMFPEALEQYQQALALDNDNAGIKNNYGRFLCERDDYEIGMQLLNEALVMPLNNKKWFAYTNIGLCEMRKGNQTVAEANFRNALQFNKNFAPALFEMQKISYHSAKYMSARAFLQRYLSVSQHNSESLWYAVQTERALGNQKLAENYREKLFRLFPASKEAQQLKTDVR